jgi:hypothetical protein
VCLALPVLAKGNGQPTWTAGERAAATSVLDLIPDGATVAASNRLAPHLTNRCRVSLFPLSSTADWVVMALPSAGWPLSTLEEQERVAALPGLNYRVVARSGDVVLYRRG